MNRYKKANEGIHAPEHVKERAAGPQGRRRGYPRWAGAVFAALAAVVFFFASAICFLLSLPGLF